jgi:plastocyanin
LVFKQPVTYRAKFTCIRHKAKKPETKIQILKTMYNSTLDKLIFLLFFITVVFFTGCTKDDEGSNIAHVTKNITTNTTWRADSVYVIKGSVDVYKTTLTIEPGTTVKFEAGASLNIGISGTNNSSTLIANGTADKPITFTSAAANPVAGDWKGIKLYSCSYNNSMKYCLIQYSGEASNGAIYLSSTDLALNNCQIQDALAYGIRLDYDAVFSDMNNNTFEKCGDHPVRMPASKAHTIGTGNIFNCPEGKGINITDSKSIEGACTWKNLNKPYYAEGSLDVYKGILTIEPGTTIKFKPEASLKIGISGTSNSSSLVAIGTADKPITFTSAAANPVAGDWKGIKLYSCSYNNSMKYCLIQYSGEASNGAIYLSSTDLALNNCRIQDALAYGIRLDYDALFSDMNNNTIEKCGDHPVRMPASKAQTIGLGNVFNCPEGKGINITDSKSIEGVCTWKNLNKPYYAEGSLDVYKGFLTIEPGTIVKFKPGSGIKIGTAGTTNSSSFVANGTADKPIKFTSAASNPVAGDWNGIQFNNYSFNNSLKYCKVQYAGNGTTTYRAAVSAYYSDFTVRNSQIYDSSSWGIYYNSSATFNGSDNVFQSCALGEIKH